MKTRMRQKMSQTIPGEAKNNTKSSTSVQKSEAKSLGVRKTISKYFHDPRELRTAFLQRQRNPRKEAEPGVAYLFSERYQNIDKLLSRINKELKSSPSDPEFKILARLNKEKDSDSVHTQQFSDDSL